MVIRGNTRGNGRQLGYYLLAQRDNDGILILEVDGRPFAREDYLHQTIFGMQLNSELTRSAKGLYHAQINPAPAEAQRMGREDWLKAADILGAELGLGSQRRIIVLHEKKGRTHAHVVWERYDHATGKVVSDSYSRLAQDRARQEMERVFAHAPTPRRNQHRPELKAALTELWGKTRTGAEFIREARKAGYMVAAGSMRNPFMVVDENGRSFDLVRQLKGIRIKEVRSRMRGEKLIPEQEAIELMRTRQGGSSGKSGQQEGQGKQNAQEAASQFAQSREDITKENKQTMQEQEEENSQEKKKRLAREFAESREKATKKTEQAQENNLEEFRQSKEEITGEEKEQKKTIGQEFTENRKEVANELTEREKRKQEFIEEMKEIQERNRQKSKGRSFVILLLFTFNFHFKGQPEKAALPENPLYKEQRMLAVIKPEEKVAFLP
ncbi:relaxase/mobilization nuclease domain-containing protein [Rufibacter quisquiliarum]|uniref:MobA/VirD2-like nuclease domain-containing protein n=1 Tax=Rufibacter quisquiliarum TaxID=1549639 RepID=A0A839GIJ6_9BACT|nr:relaxase/mobilization nuclease domain-containing protein [Rufibacter quisquiliarum]MBA9076559.1 hypothetical protein [Rufibacter quisquiliarum]